MIISDTDTAETGFSHESGQSDRNNLSKPIQISYDDMYKIVLVGAPSVGKSAIVQRFCHDNFIVEHYPTLGKIADTVLL
jgi:GTPase SAR1 family protein